MSVYAAVSSDEWQASRLYTHRYTTVYSTHTRVVRHDTLNWRCRNIPICSHNFTAI